jgi:DNA (cytosine-5)-methyltransferase 1
LIASLNIGFGINVVGRSTVKSFELFTGAGGLALGTHAVGFEHLGLVEWNADACKTLNANVSEHTVPGIDRWRVHHADIRKFDFSVYKQETVDLVAGGVPCQPFSIGGKHQGMDDERDMFPQFVRAVRTLQPRAFIIENVKGLMRRQFQNYFQYIILQLSFPEVLPKKGEDWVKHLERLERHKTKGTEKGLRYNVIHRLLNAADYGVPQRRERVFIVGFRHDTGLEFHFPEATHSRAALEQSMLSGAYWARHKILARDSFTSKAVADGLKPWATIRDAIKGLAEPRAGDPLAAPDHRLNPGARSYPGHTGSDVDLPSKTLKAGVHGVPGGENMIAFPDGTVRYLTVREAARVQSFPDAWYFAGAWSEAMRQLGNAVPLKLAEVVAQSVAVKLAPPMANP